MIEWQSNPPQEYMTWHEAIEYAKSLGDGWRLPTRAELIDACDNKIEGFEAIYYWSSSTYAQDTNRAWRLAFDDGGVGTNDKTYKYFVRCVRELKENKKMDKEEIQNKIKQLEKELNKLKNKMTNSTWEPYENGYYIDGNGMCYEVEGLGHKYPAPHNCFRTKELAELRAKQREAENELFNIWEYLVGDWRPDWNDKKAKYYGYWEFKTSRFVLMVCYEPISNHPYRIFPFADFPIRQYELASDHAKAYMRGEF